MKEKTARIAGIDAFRLVASLCVIFIHVGYFNSFNSFIGIEIRLLGRWAVPFFFIVSGYFISDYFETNPHKIGLQAAKAFMVLAISNLLMAPLIFIESGPIEVAKKLLDMDIILNGTYYHLWFLSSLTIGLMTFYFLCILNLRRLASLWIFACLCIIIFDTYHPEYRPIGTSARYLMCFPFLFLGHFVKQRNLRPHVFISLTLVLIGLLMQNGEALILKMVSDKSPLVYDFLMGTIPFSLGMFFLSMNISSSKAIDFFSSQGKRFSLGIYIFHPYFIFIIREYLFSGNYIGNWYYDVFVIPLTFILTWTTLIIAYRLFPFLEGLLSANKQNIQKIDTLIPFPPAMPAKKG
jgi:surface polysaccharide O-acyltransferase-like enzyme